MSPSVITKAPVKALKAAFGLIADKLSGGSRERIAALEIELERERQRRLSFQRSLGLPLHDDALLERELWARAYQGDDEAAEILSGLYAAGLERE